MIRTRLGLAAIVAVAAVGVGTGAAIALSGPTPSDSGQPGSVIAEGTTSTGAPYSISRMSEETITALEKNGATPVADPKDAICIEVAAHGMRGGGCVGLPAPGTIEPAQVTLAEDMIVYALASDEVRGFEVVRADGKSESMTAPEPAQVGDTRLFHVVLQTPAESLPTDQGLPVPPAVEIKALDADGKALEAKTLDLSTGG